MTSSAVPTTLPNWQIRFGSTWTPCDSSTALLFEAAFQSTARVIDVNVPVMGTHEFNVSMMTWADMPLRRDNYSNNPLPSAMQFEYWDENGFWTSYNQYDNQNFADCIANGRDNTTIYIGQDDSSWYSVDLVGLVQINLGSGRPRPIKSLGNDVSLSGDDKGVDPMHIDDDGNIPDEFKCPITTTPFMIPVIAADGHTYEYAAINKWLTGKNKSPVTGKRLSHFHLTVNHNLRKLMMDWIAIHQPDHASVPQGSAKGKKRMRMMA